MMYILIKFEREDMFLGVELFSTAAKAKKRLKKLVMAELKYMDACDNFFEIDSIVSERDFEYGEDALCEEVGVEVGHEWTWARVFDNGVGCALTERCYVIQMVNEGDIDNEDCA